MRLAFDTNIFAYAEGVNADPRGDRAIALLDRHRQDETFVAVQTLGELFSVLMRKSRLSGTQAKARVDEWADAMTPVPTTPEVLADAMALVATHRIGCWDAIVLSAAASAECAVLFSEDMQDGFSWRGVTVRNPFAA